MSCYHPMVGIWKGEYTASGKKKYQISCSALDPTFHDIIGDTVTIPCGNCIGCRLDYSRAWADRMMLELETAGKGIFLTLTYDNDHAHWTHFSDDMTPLFATVDKRDCQLFMKRLRRHFSDVKVRFYLASEYGEHTLRPHYHCILFGIGLDDIKDKQPFGKNELGQQYYISPSLADIWSKGFIMLSDVSWETCAYVARYVTKKLNGPAAEKYALMNVEKEFSLMSRNPGIGSEYLSQHPDCLDYNTINVSTETGGKQLSIPKYYLRKLELTDPDKVARMKAERKLFAEDKYILKLRNTSLGCLDMLEAEEDAKINRTKILSRSKV